MAKRFGATVALDGVDLDVHAGEVHALIGENGAGKSTLMRILSGACPADAGRMWLDGTPYAPRRPADGRDAGVAMIYQELSLAQHLTVAENLLLGREPTRGPFVRARLAARQAAEAMRAIGHDDIPLDTVAGRLSIAQQQMVEIARSQVAGSRVLVLDEPTSSLGPADIDRLFALIRRLRARGQAVVYISHVLDEVCAIADRFTVLRDGRAVGTGRVGDVSTDQIVALMVGRRVQSLYPRSRRTPGEVVLEVRALAGRDLPRSASLCLRRGEVLGIAGLVGSGRTQLLRAIFGLDRVRSGTVKVRALSGQADPHARWAQGVGMVSEDRKREGLAAGLSVADNVTLAALPRLGRWGVVTPSAGRRACLPWLAKLRIKCRSADQRVAALSGGNQQKVAVARLLQADADVLLLDEPTRGIDVGSKAELYRLIDEWACGDPATGRAPKAVLIVSSYLPELLGICDRLAVMHRGRLGQWRDVDAFDAHALMRQATGTMEPAE